MGEALMGMGLGMLAITITWFCALAAFAGIGLAYLRWSGFGRSGPEGLFAAVWVGWAFTLGGLQIWHLFWPIDWWTRALFVALGLGAFLWNLPFLLQQARPVLGRTVAFSVMSILLAVWLANQAMAPVMHYDAGLYHLSAVRWNQAYRIVPGLGNLQGRLAYNSSYFLYMAALDFGPWSHRAQHVAAYLLVLILGLQVGTSGYAVIRRGRSIMGQDLFRLALLPMVVAKMFTGINDAEPDLAFSVIGIVIIDQMVGLLLDGRGGKGVPTAALSVLMLSSAAIVVKLSAAVLAILSSVIALAWVARRRGQSAAADGPSGGWFKTLAPAMLLIAVWTIRGFVLSGYPAYPSALGGLNVDWRVPAGSASTMGRWIMSWARIPGQNPNNVLGSWSWFRPWSKRVVEEGCFEIVIPLAICALFLLIAVARRRRWEGPALALVVIGVAPVSSLGFWFAMAPSPRFAGAAPWLLAGISLLLAAERWEVRRSPHFATGLLLVSLIGGVAPYLTAEKFWNPGPEDGFYALPEAMVIEVPLPSGLTVLDPLEGDQCWDAPPLCTADVRLDLELREAGEVGRGFRVTAE